jgi:hypothetical protein
MKLINDKLFGHYPSSILDQKAHNFTETGVCLCYQVKKDTYSVGPSR